MTAPEVRRGVRFWLLPTTVAALVVAQIVFFVLLIPLLDEQGERAAQGRQARMVQCEFRPMTLAEQRWFASHSWDARPIGPGRPGIISGEQYAKVRAVLPSEAACARVLAEK